MREADNDCDDQNDKSEHGGCSWKSWNTKAEKSSFRIKNQNKVADGVVNTVKSIFGQGDELFKICLNPAKIQKVNVWIFYTWRFCKSKAFL